MKNIYILLISSMLLSAPAHALYRGAAREAKAAEVKTSLAQSEEKKQQAASTKSYADFKFSDLPANVQGIINEQSSTPWPYWEAWLSEYSFEKEQTIVGMLVLSPTSIAIHLNNRTIEIWDITNINEPIKQSVMQNVPISARLHKLSPTKLAYENTPRSISVWDLTAPGKPTLLSTIPTTEGLTIFTAISETQLAICMENPTPGERDNFIHRNLITIWDISAPQKPTKISQFSGTRQRITSLKKLSPTLLGTTGDNEIIDIWDIGNIRHAKRIQLTIPSSAHELIPLTNTTFAAADYYKIELWDIAPVKGDDKSLELGPVFTIDATTNSCTSFSPQILAYNLVNGSVRLTDVADLKKPKLIIEMPLQAGLALHALDAHSFAYTKYKTVYIHKPDHAALNAFFKLSVKEREQLSHLLENLRAVQNKRKKTGKTTPLKLVAYGVAVFQKMPPAIQAMLKKNFNIADIPVIG